MVKIEDRAILCRCRCAAMIFHDQCRSELRLPSLWVISPCLPPDLRSSPDRMAFKMLELPTEILERILSFLEARWLKRLRLTATCFSTLVCRTIHGGSRLIRLQHNRSTLCCFSRELVALRFILNAHLNSGHELSPASSMALSLSHGHTRCNILIQETTSCFVVRKSNQKKSTQCCVPRISPH